MNFLEKTKSFMIQCKRVWHILKKPTKKEFSIIIKVSAIGILFLGLIGFFISIIMKSFFL